MSQATFPLAVNPHASSVVRRVVERAQGAALILLDTVVVKELDNL